MKHLIGPKDTARLIQDIDEVIWELHAGIAPALLAAVQLLEGHVKAAEALLRLARKRVVRPPEHQRSAVPARGEDGYVKTDKYIRQINNLHLINNHCM